MKSFYQEYPKYEKGELYNLYLTIDQVQDERLNVDKP
jgi:hypothetical protein